MHIDLNTLLLILAIIFLLLAGYFNFNRPKNKKKTAKETPRNSDVITLRLQAYERLVLLMERLNPQELVMRYVAQAATVSDLQLLLLSTIRSETEYNYSQQLYVSNEAWSQIMAARNSVTSLVIQAATALQPEEPATALSRKIIELSSNLNPSPTHTAIKVLKQEIRAIL